MIELQTLSGQAFALNSDTRIILKKRSTLFISQFLPTDYTLPFLLPIKGNEGLINWQHLHQTHSEDYEIPARLMIYGNLEMEGILHLKFSDKDNVQAELRSVLNGEDKLATYFPNTIDGSTQDDSPAVNGRVWPFTSYCWPSYINDDEYFNATYLHKWVNRHDSNGFVLTSGGNLVPLGISLYLGYVLKTVCHGMGYSADGDLFQDQEMMTIHLWNNHIFLWTGGNWLVDESNLVPDMSVNDFFVAIKKSLGLRLTIDTRNQTIWFDKIRTVRDKDSRMDVTSKTDYDIPIDFSDQKGVNVSLSFSDSYSSAATKDVSNIEIAGTINLSSLLFGSGASVGEYWRCTGDNAIYYIDENGDHQFHAYLYNEVATLDQDADLRAGVGPLVDFLDYPDVEEQLLPRCDYPINDRTQRNTFALHLLFFRGYSETEKSIHQYPLSTAHNLKLIQANPNYEIVGQYSLYPNGDYGTYANWYVEFDKWISTGKAVKTRLYWGLSEWKQFDQRTLLQIYGINYAWVEMDVVLNLKGVEYVNAKLIKT